MSCALGEKGRALLICAVRYLPPSESFLRESWELPRNIIPSGKGVADRHASKLLPILKVFTVKNVTLAFDRRSDNQRIVPRQPELSPNPQRLSVQSRRGMH